jgi:hypothetical protein
MSNLTQSLPMKIRPAKPEERNYIRSSWVRSFSSSGLALLATPHTSSHTTCCTTCGKHQLRSDRVDGFTRYRAGKTYFEGQAKLVERLLDSCNVSVAVLDDAGLVDGWIVRELVRPIVHYVYVRHSARKLGVARALVSDLLEQPARFTHFPSGLQPGRLPAAWTHDPYVLMVP